MEFCLTGNGPIGLDLIRQWVEFLKNKEK